MFQREDHLIYLPICLLIIYSKYFLLFSQFIPDTMYPLLSIAWTLLSISLGLLQLLVLTQPEWIVHGGTSMVRQIEVVSPYLKVVLPYLKVVSPYHWVVYP